jgi:hypothetical protein
LSDARGIVNANAGTQFDPDVVAAFELISDQELIQIRDEAPDIP